MSSALLTASFQSPAILKRSVIKSSRADTTASSPHVTHLRSHGRTPPPGSASPRGGRSGPSSPRRTGLRANELRQLTAGRCRLRATQPHILAEASTTKNKKRGTLYLRPRTAEAVLEHIATKTPAAAVFNMPNSDRTAKMLRADLDDARTAWIGEVPHDPEDQARRRESDFLAYLDAEERRLDFHALRYTCGRGWRCRASTPTWSSRSCGILRSC